MSEVVVRVCILSRTMMKFNHCDAFINERRKKERSKQGQTNKQGKAIQHTQGSHFS